jgi:exodeoxyribonuclease VII large subunit
VYPTAVQGEGAALEVVAALERAGRRAECDVLILCRGGGSIEDLWSFNDERVARSIRACPVPVVVGVGHETDFTIADFAADRRAPTPTAAAEFASPSRADLLSRISDLRELLHRRMTRDLETRMQLLDHLARRLVHPARRLQAQAAVFGQLVARVRQAAARAFERERWRLAGLVERSHRCIPRLEPLSEHTVDLARRLQAASGQCMADREARLRALERSLAALDPIAVLERGYSIVRDREGHAVRDSAAGARGDRLDLTFARGMAQVRVEDKT